MKKIICIVICIAFLVILTSCGTKLPKGEASRIDFTDGWTIDESTFEYVDTADGFRFSKENGNYTLKIKSNMYCQRQVAQKKDLIPIPIPYLKQSRC